MPCLRQLPGLGLITALTVLAATQRDAAPQPASVNAPEAIKSVDTALQLLQQAGPAGAPQAEPVEAWARHRATDNC
jgi:hypothetical protein